jgi:hypothetical protein
VAESCDGITDDCPADVFEPVTTVCRGAAGVCDAEDTCDGAGACDADAKLTLECRADAGDCDVAEVCDGITDDCPADAFEPNGTSCEDGDVCTAGDECDSGVCISGTPVPDGDGDGFCDTEDNCPFVYNVGQTNSDFLPAGDACQCGDIDGDSRVYPSDLALARAHLMGKTITGDITYCNVVGDYAPAEDGSDCDVADIYALSRYIAGETVTLGNVCKPYFGGP